MLIVKIPRGRGKTRIDRPWAKTVTAVDRNATTGRDYAGCWLTYGSTVEAEAGDVIAVQDADGNGAALYVLVPDYLGADQNGQAERRPEWYEIESAAGKDWAGKCAATTRQWLALSPSDRVARAHQERIADIERRLAEWREKPDDAPGVSAKWIDSTPRNKVWWVDYFGRLLAAAADTADTADTAEGDLADRLERAIDAGDVAAQRAIVAEMRAMRATRVAELAG